MPLTRRDDLAYSALLIMPLALFASTSTGLLYTSVFYILGIPATVVVWGVILRAPALFLTGATAAAVGALLMYMVIAINLNRPEGLLVLGHLFSAPGMLLGMFMSSWLLRHNVRATLPWIVAGFGFLGSITGFLVAQLIVCNTLMYCGAASIGF